jgi:hypothetical protein
VGKIHLVVSPQPAPAPSNTRLTFGDYFADVLLDKRNHLRIYHWIVQRAGSPSIIFCGQERSYQEACDAAQTYLQRLVQKDSIHTA